MSIIRVGSNQKYSNGWESAFGKESAKKSGASAAKKTAKKKSAKSAVKKSAKKKKK
ncbi:MAG: hypothetical protein ACIALR_05105 [Blastopirellula sp. JB062]